MKECNKFPFLVSKFRLPHLGHIWLLNNLCIRLIVGDRDYIATLIYMKMAAISGLLPLRLRPHFLRQRTRERVVMIRIRIAAASTPITTTNKDGTPEPEYVYSVIIMLILKDGVCVMKHSESFCFL